MTTRTFAALAVLGLCGCAPSQPAPSPSPSGEPIAGQDVFTPATRQRGGSASNELKASEIQGTTYSTALQMIRALRPTWLNNRGGQVPDMDGSVEPQVWLNGRRLGGVESLSRVDVTQIISMRYIAPVLARATYGPGNGRGVIVVQSH